MELCRRLLSECSYRLLETVDLLQRTLKLKKKEQKEKQEEEEEQEKKEEEKREEEELVVGSSVLDQYLI